MIGIDELFEDVSAHFLMEKDAVGNINKYSTSSNLSTIKRKSTNIKQSLRLTANATRWLGTSPINSPTNGSSIKDLSSFMEMCKRLQTSGGDDDGEHWVNFPKRYRDNADLSAHPSYVLKNVSYYLNCEQFYLAAKAKYDAQFFYEMQKIITLEPRASDQFFTKRLFSYNSLWPPLHTKRELEYFISHFFKLKPHERTRLDYLMKTDIT